MLKHLIEQLKARHLLPARAHVETDGHSVVQLAAAVLMIEMMAADDACSEPERDAMVTALRTQFHLDEAGATRLVDLAHDRRAAALDLQSFTSELNRGLDPGEKTRIAEALWRVALADGELAHVENQLMMKLADLLYIDRGALFAAKARVTGH